MVVVCVGGDMATHHCSSLIVKKTLVKERKKKMNPYPGDASRAPQFIIPSSPRFLAPCRPVVVV